MEEGAIETADVVAFAQARMSSRRFPGKVLAPFRGRPIIDHVLAAVRVALPSVPVVVAIADDEADDPLAAYLAAKGASCFRGPRDDVLRRFRGCLDMHPADWVLRICADSPLLNVHVLRAVAARANGRPRPDLVTTTAVRTLPRGQNVELIRGEVLRALDDADLPTSDREHVTAHLHRNGACYRVVNVASLAPSPSPFDLAVDTIEDLHRLEALDDAAIEAYRGGPFLQPAA